MKSIFMAVLFALCITCMPIASAQDVWVFSNESKGYDYYVDDTSPYRLFDGSWAVHYTVVTESGERIKSDTMCFFIEGTHNRRIRYYDMSQRDNIKTANIYNESGHIYLWLEDWKKDRM